MDRLTLHAQQINHGQSEIWLEFNGKPASNIRKLATNEVVNVCRRFCTGEVFEAFYANYHTAVGHVASLAASNIEEIAAELQLKVR